MTKPDVAQKFQDWHSVVSYPLMDQRGTKKWTLDDLLSFEMELEIGL